MIIKEPYMTRRDGVQLFRTYSDRGVYIRKDGTDEKYEEAIDVENAPFLYIETDETVVLPEDSEHREEEA